MTTIDTTRSSNKRYLITGAAVIAVAVAAYGLGRVYPPLGPDRGHHRPGRALCLAAGRRGRRHFGRYVGSAADADRRLRGDGRRTRISARLPAIRASRRWPRTGVRCRRSPPIRPQFAGAGQGSGSVRRQLDAGAGRLGCAAANADAVQAQLLRGDGASMRRRSQTWPNIRAAFAVIAASQCVRRSSPRTAAVVRRRQRPTRGDGRRWPATRRRSSRWRRTPRRCQGDRGRTRAAFQALAHNAAAFKALAAKAAAFVARGGQRQRVRCQPRQAMLAPHR